MINQKTLGVTIADKHSYNDFGLIMTKKFISKPEPKINIIEVPGSSDIIDLSESISGHVEYKPRTIQVEFMAAVEALGQADKYSQILEYWNGAKSRIVFDDDPAFFWLGRAVAEMSNDGRAVTVTLEATVEPYKLDDLATNEAWLWDPFDFDDDYIYEGGSVEVDGVYEYVILGREKRTYPSITASATMTVNFKGKSYQINPGSNRMYEIILDNGENTLEFVGYGTVLVEYRGGLL